MSYDRRKYKRLPAPFGPQKRTWTLRELSDDLRRSLRQIQRDKASGLLRASKIKGRWIVNFDQYNDYSVAIGVKKYIEKSAKEFDTQILADAWDQLGRDVEIPPPFWELIYLLQRHRTLEIDRLKELGEATPELLEERERLMHFIGQFVYNSQSLRRNMPKDADRAIIEDLVRGIPNELLDRIEAITSVIREVQGENIRPEAE